MTFLVGQKIECIDVGGVGFLVKGQIYTVSSRCPVCAKAPDDSDVYTYIDTTGNPHSCGTRCNSWRARYFRPIVERKTDISIFKRALVPGSKVSEPV